MSGLHSDSHIPYNRSVHVHVPLTTKSSVNMGQPIRSMAAMKGSLVFGSSPASLDQKTNFNIYKAEKQKSSPFLVYIAVKILDP